VALSANDLPPWEAVYQQMRRWIDARCFEINGRGSAHSSARVCRAQGPAHGDDSRQPYVCSPRRNRARVVATMVPSAARDRRFTQRWIRWAICWPCTLRRPMNRTARRWRSWLKQCKRLPVRTSNWRMSIRDIQVKRGAGRREARRAAGGGQTYRGQTRLCGCCRAAGWWSAASPGLRAFRRLARDYETPRQGAGSAPLSRLRHSHAR